MMNKLKFIFFFLFIFIIIVSYNLFFHKSCKTPIIFKSIMNLETQQLKNCISKDHLTKNLTQFFYPKAVHPFLLRMF